MGMYTELAINVEFRPGVDAETIDFIRKLCECNDVSETDIPEKHRSHPFFATERWSWCIRSAGSAYFHTRCHRAFVEADGMDGYDGYGLLVWTNIKNYNEEWEKLLSWLAPMLRPEDHPYYIGHIRYEEYDRPTALYLFNGRVVQERPTAMWFETVPEVEITEK